MFVRSRKNLHAWKLPLAGSRSPLVKYARGSHIGFRSTCQTRSCALRMPRCVTFTDNDPCHLVKVVMSYLSEQDFEIMDWPPQSPGLNPIENLWKTLGVKVMEISPTNTEDLWVKLQEEWSKISIKDCQELIRSCSRRCAAVIESKDSYSKYWLYMNFYCFWLFTLFFSIFTLLLDVQNLTINK